MTDPSPLPDDPARPDAPARPGRRGRLLTAALMTAFAVSRLAVAGIGSEREYDEGVYLLSTRAILAGEQLFTQVFSSQPPAFLEGLALVMRVTDDNLFVAHCFSLFWALVALGAAANLARRLAGPVAAPLAVAAWIAGPTFVDLAHTVQAEVPALALALVAMNLVLRSREGGWTRAGLVGAGATFAAALLFKLFVAPLAAPLGLLLLLAPPRNPVHGWSLDLRGAPARALLFAAGTVGVLALPLLWYAPRPLYEQTIAFHIAKFRSYHATPRVNLMKLAQMLAADPVVTGTAAAGLAFVAVRNRLAAAWLAVWTALMVLVIRGQTPLFWRHLVLIVPPLAIAASAAFAIALQGVARPLRIAGTAAAIVLMLLPSVVQLHGSRSFLATLPHPAAMPWLQQRAEEDGVASPLAQTAKWIRANTLADELVVTDDPIAVYLAGRRVPGELCDTSHARIHAHSLTLALATLHTAGVRVVVLRDGGRLSRLKGYLPWLAHRYDRQPSLDTDVPPHRTVWIRKRSRTAAR